MQRYYVTEVRNQSTAKLTKNNFKGFKTSMFKVLKGSQKGTSRFHKCLFFLFNPDFETSSELRRRKCTSKERHSKFVYSRLSDVTNYCGHWSRKKNIKFNRHQHLWRGATFQLLFSSGTSVTSVLLVQQFNLSVFQNWSVEEPRPATIVNSKTHR